jgi:gamma-glutamylcyclotransferase (GGCT)/AIG2-like uncharacterized protein YtfP
LTDRFFAYGTLEIPELMEALTGRRLPSTPAVLAGFARFVVRGRAYPGIVAVADARTEGRLYSEIDARLIRLLDRFEGDLYERRRVSVRARGRAVSAFAYIVRASRRRHLHAEEWDRERFVAAHLARFLTLCREFRLRDRARSFRRCG